jgi:hypothetical protein
MRTRLSSTFLAGLGCLACACGSQPRPSARAVAVEQIQCTESPTVDEEQMLRLMQGTTVIKSQPLYSLVPTKADQPEARVNGATLVVQPPAGVTADRMTRALQCHSARAVLSQTKEPSFADDPFVLPGSWLDINVEQMQGRYAVTIAARNVHDGLRVLENANAFAENRGGAVDNRCIAWRTVDPNRECAPLPPPAKE